MKRRDFSRQLAGAGLGLAVAGAVRAQPAAPMGPPVEGQQYVKLQTPVQPSLPAGKKVEVIEFFWYGCPHCFALEPSLEGWAKQLPPDVYFHTVPFAFIGTPEQQKLYYALDQIGQRDAMHRKIFNAIHVQNKRLNTEAEMTAFVVANGVDGAKFTDAYKSFSVNKKMSDGKTLSNAYKIDGVPALGVQGRYFTTVGLAGSQDRALAVTDYLIQRSRQAA